MKTKDAAWNVGAEREYYHGAEPGPSRDLNSPGQVSTPLDLVPLEEVERGHQLLIQVLQVSFLNSMTALTPCLNRTPVSKIEGQPRRKEASLAVSCKPNCAGRVPLCKNVQLKLTLAVIVLGLVAR